MADSDVVITISGDATGIQKAFQDATGAAQAAANAITEQFEKLHKSFELLGLRIALVKETFKQLGEIASGGELGELAKQAGEFGEQIEIAGQKTGLSSEQLQGLKFAAASTNVGFDQLVQGLARFSLKLVEATTEGSATQRALAALGLSAKDVKGVGLDVALGNIADKFEEANDGAGKTAIAMALFGRAGADLIPLLNKGSGGIQAVIERAHELGVVFEGEATTAMAEYGAKVKEVAAVHEAMSLQLGVALIPTMSKLADAFSNGLREGGPFKTFIEGLGTAIEMTTSILSHLAQGFQELGTIIGATAAQLANPSLWGAIQEEADRDLQKIATGWEKFRDDLKKPMEAHIDTGTDDGTDWGDKRKPKKDLNLDTKPKRDSDTVMAQLEKELSDRKAALAAENALNGTFYQVSKRDEAEFWEESLSRADGNEKAQLQIQRKANDLKVADNLETFTAQLATYEKDIAAAQFNYAKKLSIAKDELAAVKQHFGDQSKEYQEGLAKITKLEQDAAEQTKKIEQIKAQARRDSALAGIDLEEQRAILEVSLGQRTDAQLIADEIRFENQRYAIQLEGLAEREALNKAAGDDPAAQAKIDAEKLAAASAYQAKLYQIKARAAQQDSVLQRSLTANLEAGFQKMVSGVLTGTLKMRDIMKQTWQSIADSLAQAVTTMVKNWLIGELTKTTVTQSESALRVQKAAGEAAANAYNAIVGIPYVGPFLAPAAAAVAYAAVTAFAQDGYDVPAGVNPVTQLHAKEMVLPAKHADVIRSMSENGGGAGGGGAVTHNWNIQALDGASVKRVLMANGQHIVSSIKAQGRSFNPA